MQMALGDALAVALLTRRGFTAADFHQFHPGGRLGARLRRVRDLMHAGDAMPLAAPDTPMDRALLLMTEKRFGCLGVVDAAGRLIGIVTDGDLRRAMGPDLLSRQVGDVMTSAPRTIAPDALAAEALHAMNARERPITALFVVDPRGPADRHPAHPRPAARRRRMSVTPLPRRPAPAGPASTWSPPPPAASAARPMPGGLARRRLVINLDKWLLPAGALLLLATIALWPEIRPRDGQRRASPTSAAAATSAAPP